MCFDSGARPPIAPIAGGALDTRGLTLKASDGTVFAAFAARAAQPTGIGVVILPDIRGLHHYYEELAERFAEQGYDAVAIDYFGRTAGVGRGEARGDDFDWQTHVAQTKLDKISQDTAAAVAYLHSAEGGADRTIFSVGFCFGGSNSWQQAAEGHGLAGAIGFYGRPLPPTRDGSKAPIERVDEYTAPLLGLFGGADQGIPESAVNEFDEALSKADKPHEFKIYPGAPHSFFDRRFEQYQAECADAWQRILGFIKENSPAA
ncbi:MAG TPA: dienelactone hydrolase family protein [Thermomicrobiaceae bacterium]|nr:dienelactone hydrolase family protein [Thermomicrobiaceae bacterium]